MTVRPRPEVRRAIALIPPTLPPILSPVPSPHEWTLPAIARVLDEPEHRLIYLCEKAVVVPDFGDARGRGSSRRFSSRNLLEFAIAIHLRPFGIPSSTAATILHSLRAIETRIAEQLPGVDFVNSLRARADIELRAIVSDGDQLFFLLRQAKRSRLFGGVTIDGSSSTRGSRAFARVRELPLADGRVTVDDGVTQAVRGFVRLDVNVGEIARALKL